jgi:uncharacterized protein
MSPDESLSPDESGANGVTPRLRPCPICGKLALAEWKPFCSKRCADIDLNRWLSGIYAVPVQEDDEAQSAADPDNER